MTLSTCPVYLCAEGTSLWLLIYFCKITQTQSSTGTSLHFGVLFYFVLGFFWFFSIGIPLPCFSSRALCSSDGSDSEAPGARGSTGTRERPKAARAALRAARCHARLGGCRVCEAIAAPVRLNRHRRGAPFWVFAPLSLRPRRLLVAAPVAKWLLEATASHLSLRKHGGRPRR